MRLPLHVSAHNYNDFLGAREQYFVQLLIQSNLVTAQSTAHETPEDGRNYGPKHVGAASLECF